MKHYAKDHKKYTRRQHRPDEKLIALAFDVTGIEVQAGSYSGFQLRVQERGAFGVRRALAALVFTQRKAARARRTPNAPRRRSAYPFRKGCKFMSAAQSR